MGYQQEANDFVLAHGLKKSQRIVSVNHPFYSDKTGSYYAKDINQSVSIKHLKKAINEYIEINKIDKILKSKLDLFRGVKNDTQRS